MAWTISELTPHTGVRDTVHRLLTASFLTRLSSLEILYLQAANRKHTFIDLTFSIAIPGWLRNFTLTGKVPLLWYDLDANSLSGDDAATTLSIRHSA